MYLPLEVIRGILIPFAGTALGAACVFFVRGSLHKPVQRAFTGFAAGVMVAASVWSLLIPAMDQAEASGQPAFVPAVAGFWAGVLFLLLLDHIIPHLHMNSEHAEGPAVRISRTAKLVLAVTLHNIPEGMAVGVVYAGYVHDSVTISGGEGDGRLKAFTYGVLSGIVEPIGALFMIAAIEYMLPLLPYFLSFAAGAMLYVVVEELIPEMSEGEHSDIGTMAFAAGFSLMMALDVMLG